MSVFRENFRRLKKRPPPEEDANLLKFNEEFKSGSASEYSCLSLSEVIILLEQVKFENPENHGTCVDKMIDYCKIFRTFKGRETIEEIRRTLNKHILHEYEISQLINFVPSNLGEAKSYIPSLALRFNDEKIEEIIEDINELKKYQG
ncbi:18276_t:CDS:2 [Funneliformis geosporum]|nr:18276_t:CDS:2 [Funneliformis geosporum]